MTQIIKKTYSTLTHFAMLLVVLLVLNGCAHLGLADSDGQMTPASTPGHAAEIQPFYPTEFQDLLIPGELTWNREESMVIRTDSFAGGILHFSGRVEINSLSNFFISTMERNNWRIAGSVQYKKIMLVFVKPNKTCTIIIRDADFGTRANVYIYITEDLGGGTTSPTRSKSIIEVPLLK